MEQCTPYAMKVYSFEFLEERVANCFGTHDLTRITQLFNSMGRSSWEAQLPQKLPAFHGLRRCHRVNKNLPVVPVLNQMNSARIVLSRKSISVLFHHLHLSFRSSCRSFGRISPRLLVCYMLCPSHTWVDRFNTIWRGVKTTKALVTKTTVRIISHFLRKCHHYLHLTP
jgi:hypothetical protein